VRKCITEAIQHPQPYTGTHPHWLQVDSTNANLTAAIVELPPNFHLKHVHRIQLRVCSVQCKLCSDYLAAQRTAYNSNQQSPISQGSPKSSLSASVKSESGERLQQGFHLVHIKFIIRQCNILHRFTRSSSSRMHVINHNWSATKQRQHLQSAAETSRHSALSGDRIRQRETLCGSRDKDTDQCLQVATSPCRHCSVPVSCENGPAETTATEGGRNPAAGPSGHTLFT